MIKSYRKISEEVKVVQLTEKLYEDKKLDEIIQELLGTGGVTVEKFGANQLSIKGVEPCEFIISLNDWIIVDGMGMVDTKPDEKFKELYEEI